MSFFVSNEKKPVNQTSKTFNSQNGLEYSANSKIVLEVPPDAVEFFDPSSSYLKMSVQIEHSTKNLVQIDPLSGGQILFSQIRIMNMAGVLLEELDNVSTLSNILAQFSDDMNNQRKRGLTEGQVLHNPEQAGMRGLDKSRYTNTQFNPWFKPSSSTTPEMLVVPLCIKLPTAIFSSQRIWANQVFGGLRIELICAPNTIPFKLIQSSMDDSHCPLVDAVNGGAIGSGVPKSTDVTSIELSYFNSFSEDTDKCPFVVGSTVNINDSVATKNFDAVIEGITIDASKRISLAVTKVTSPATALDTKNSITVKTKSTELTGNNFKYKISDVALVVEEIGVDASYRSAMMKAMKENGGLSYECHAWQNYRHSVTKGTISATVNLNVLNQKAKAIMVIPTKNQPVTQDQAVIQFGSRQNVSGEVSGATDFQWYYNQKLQPDRPVPCDKMGGGVAYNGEYLTELQKSMVFFGIPPSHSFNAIKENFVYPRALALANQVVDLRNSDFQILVNYGSSGSSDALLLNCWVAHVRTFKATPSGVVVEM